MKLIYFNFTFTFMTKNDDFFDILLHKEGTKYFEIRSIKNLEISTNIYRKLNFLHEQIKKLDDNGFIIVPAYQNEYNTQFQLVVTGKCKVNENPLSGLLREVKEELGLTLMSNINLNKIPDEKIDNMYFSIITSNNIKKNDNNIVVNQFEDNYNMKIICWVYVNKINEKLIFNRKRLFSDDIAGESICIIPVELVKYILNKWIKNKIKKISKYSFMIN